MGREEFFLIDFVEDEISLSISSVHHIINGVGVTLAERLTPSHVRCMPPTSTDAVGSGWAPPLRGIDRHSLCGL